MNTLTLSSGNSAPIPSIVISADGTNTFKTSTNTIATWIVVYYHPITSLHDFVAQWMYHYDLSDDFSYGGFSITIPPSPTLSNVSSFAHFQTSLALRDNKPVDSSHQADPVMPH